MCSYYFSALDTAGVELHGVIQVLNADLALQLIKQQGMSASKLEPLYGDVYRVRGRFSNGGARLRYFEAASLDALTRSLRGNKLQEVSRVIYYCGRKILSVRTIGLRAMKKTVKSTKNGAKDVPTTNFSFSRWDLLTGLVKSHCTFPERVKVLHESTGDSFVPDHDRLVLSPPMLHPLRMPFTAGDRCHE